MFEGSPVQRTITFGSLGIAGALMAFGSAFSPVAANAVAGLPPGITSKLGFKESHRIVPNEWNQEWVAGQEFSDETRAFVLQWHDIAVENGTVWGQRMTSLNQTGTVEGPQIIEGGYYGIERLVFRWDGEIQDLLLADVTAEQMAAFKESLTERGGFYSQGAMFTRDPNEDLK